jgi:hypothetical protein
MATDANSAIRTGGLRSGLAKVGAYQVAGRPFVTGSADLDNETVHMVEFDYVSKSITIINPNANTGEDIRVHFQSGSATAVSSPGASGKETIAASGDAIANFHYITVPAGNSSVTLDVKCAKFYISNLSTVYNLKYEVFAELTHIPAASMYHLTGSGITL